MNVLYGGTKSELERLVKDANEYKESIGEVGDLSSDNFADVIQAINAIQRKIGITGTTAAEAMETIQGSVNMAKAAWDNWLTGLGRTDADMGALTDQLLESVGAVASNVGPVVGRIGQALATALPDALAGAWNMAVGALGGMGIQLPTIDASQITAVFQPLADMASTVGPYIAQFAQTVLPAIGSALGPIVQLLASIVSTVLPPLLAVLGPVISVLMQLVSAILPPLSAVISALLPPIMSIVQAVLPPLMSLIMTLMPIIQQIATVIGGILISAIQMLAPIVMQIFSIGMNLLNSVIIPLLSPIMQLAQMLLPQLMAAWNMLQGPINVIIGLFGSVLGVVNSVVSAIGSLIGKIGEAASALANSPIGQAVGAVGSFLGFARGGFTSGPYIAGEDPRYPNEAVISFNPAYRAQNLRYWAMAGHMLGASPSVQASTSTGGGGASISVGGITFAPSITVRGNASKDDFVAALREVEPDFVDFVVDAIARRTEAAYVL